jgi:hypothetical protein
MVCGCDMFFFSAHKNAQQPETGDWKGEEGTPQEDT